jgi:hypothetical protein
VWNSVLVLFEVVTDGRDAGRDPAGPVVTASPAAQEPLKQSDILLATVGTLPWPYEILGLVDAALSAASGIVPTARLMARPQDQALAWGADAVIGIGLSQLTLPGASRLFRAGWFGRIEHLENLVAAIAIGTAVRQLPPEDTDATDDVG